VSPTPAEGGGLKNTALVAQSDGGGAVQVKLGDEKNNNGEGGVKRGGGCEYRTVPPNASSRRETQHTLG